MKVLVACEESQVVCKAFRDKGHESYSCDIIECSGGHLEWHILHDVIPLLNGNVGFYTSDEQYHIIKGQWDLIIAHPPYTRLCNSGQRWYYTGSVESVTHKKIEREKAIEFFMLFTKIKCEHVAIENPVGIMSTYYRKPDIIYNPYDFLNETECKKTCLWLKGLPLLYSNRITPLPDNLKTHDIWKANFNGINYSYNNPIVSRLRSKTPKGVAQAMAEQWGTII